MDLLAAASFVDPGTFSLGVAADLCFFTKVCPAVSESVSSASAARRSAVFGSKQEVTDWNTWAPAAVLSSDLHGLLAPGGGPVQVGQRSHRSPRHLGSAVGGQQRLLVDAGHVGDC